MCICLLLDGNATFMIKLINRCQYYELDKKIKSIPIRSVWTNCTQKVQLNITFTNIYSQKYVIIA